MVEGSRLSGEAELEVFEFAEAEVESRRRAKPFLRWEWFALAIAALAWVGWLLWGALGPG